MGAVEKGSTEEVLRPVPAWGALTGAADLQLDAWQSIPGSVVAEVQQTLFRYAWAFDDRREQLLEQCFTEDARWEGLVMGETGVGPFIGRAEVMRWLTRFWKYQKDQRRHIYTNLIVDRVDGDDAVAFAYLQLMGSSEAVSSIESVGFVRIRLRRDGASWRISEFFSGFDSPFWTMEVSEMNSWLRDLFGVAHPPETADSVAAEVNGGTV